MMSGTCDCWKPPLRSPKVLEGSRGPSLAKRHDDDGDNVKGVRPPETTGLIMEGSKHQIAALTPKILALYSRNPVLWFATIKSRFATTVPKITSVLTKFHYLVQALDEDTALSDRESTAGRIRGVEDMAAVVIPAHQEGEGILDPRLSRLR